jgi:type IV pilus assembly protein PilB
MKKENKKLGELLIEAGLIDEFQLKSALADQDGWGGRLGSIMIKKGFVSEKDMLSVIEKQYGFSVISLDTLLKPSDEVLKMVGVDVAKKFGMFPVGMEGKTLLIAIADPTDLQMIDDITFKLGMRVKPVLALESDIVRAIEEHYEGRIPAKNYHTVKEKFAEFDAVYEAENIQTGHEEGTSKPKADISQKTVIESLINLLVSKGIISREELIKTIKSRGRS